jgi:carboxymethylenebutenolidase
MTQQASNLNAPVRRTTLASGYAEAVRPITAQAIETDTEGLVTTEVLIPTADGDVPGYVARPATGSKFPIVIVVHEVFGVHEHIKDVCRRFAKVGYVAIAPELFVRQGDVSKITDIGQLISEVVSKTPDSQVLSDIDSTAKFAAESCEGDSARLGIVGYCWGGRVVWLYSAHSQQLKAGGAFYGKLVGQHSDLQPKFPTDVASSLNAVVHGYYGADDHVIPLDTVEAMQALLKAAGSKSEITVYPGAGHAFFADYRPSYNPEAAKAAWTHLVKFLASNGV